MPHQKHKILVAPLDWGLGHATRCIPVIECLIKLGHDVVLGVTPTTQELLIQAFPNLPVLHLPAYNVQYSKHAKTLPFKLLMQLPRLLKVIRNEHELGLKAVQELNITHIISDNRYGLWHPAIPSVILCHQVHLRIPISRWIEYSINKIHSQYLNRFDACWIPDTPLHEFAGELSKPFQEIKTSEYIGVLSRFKAGQSTTPLDKPILFLLSGPEPQRTQLEEQILKQAESINQTCVLVRGTRKTHLSMPISKHIQVIDLVHQNELQNLLARSSVVVCRSGYSTLMDLAAVGKKAILIPTPGQTEQEYLARFWEEKGNYIFTHQSELNLKSNLETQQQLPNPKPATTNNLLERTMRQWLSKER